MVPYWVGQFPSQAMFPKKTLSRSCNDMRWTGEKLLGMGFLTYQRFILSHLWVPLWRVCYILEFPLFVMQLFPSPLFAFFIKSKH
jgi:hypothetical protein